MFEIPQNDVFNAVLVFFRVGGIFFLLPVFGDSPAPLQFRILLSVAFAACIIPLIPPAWATVMPDSILVMVGMIAKELGIGLFIGYTAKLVFDAMIMAASLVGYQMGFGMSTLLIPDADQQMDAFTAFHRLMVMLVFLTLSLHHIFLKALFDTFEFIPAGGALPQLALGEFLITLTASVFATALQLAAPVLIALLFTMAGLGLVARTVPQMNVFTLSFPISFFVGLLVYGATLPFFPDWMQNRFEIGYQNIYQIIQGLRP